MTDPLFVQTDGVLNYSKLHSQVAAGLSGLAGTDGAGVQNSHGAIASAVSTALHSALHERTGAVGATSTSASTISDLLQKAAHAYTAGDEEGASRLHAAVAALEGRAGSPDSGAGAQVGPGTRAANGAAGSPGADAMGQMGQIMGQIGQQVGQLAQLVTAPLQGLAQGLQQVPQQILQGVQQAAPAGHTASPDAGLPDAGTPAEKPEDDTEREDRAQRREQAEPAPEREVRAGGDVVSGHAPVAATEPARPAPTRPQVD